MFWIGGRFLEVVAHVGSIVFKSTLFLNVPFKLGVALFIQGTQRSDQRVA